MSAISDDSEAPSPEDLRREFYTKCLLIKFSFAPKDAAQYVKVNKLYEVSITQRVLAEGVPVDQWDTYIKKQLQNPARFLPQDSGLRRRRTKLR